MKPKKFGIFATIRNIEDNLPIYKHITDIVRNKGIAMYRPEFVDNYPEYSKKVESNHSAIVEGTQRQIRQIDFAIAYFTEKSRTVFFQTILALENKIPVLCLVREDRYSDFPETLFSYGKDFITVRKYKDDSELDTIISDYVEELEPPKRRFNVVLKTNTLKELEQLCTELEISKAELIRRVIEKEYRRIFGGK